jgi:hypothetical protein
MECWKKILLTVVVLVVLIGGVEIFSKARSGKVRRRFRRYQGGPKYHRLPTVRPLVQVSSVI